MKQKIRVKINDDGITAKEINPFAGKHTQSTDRAEYRKKYLKAEKTLRTFEIQCETKYFDDLPCIGGGLKTITYYSRRGQIVDAEILTNGKIKILKMMEQEKIEAIKTRIAKIVRDGVNPVYQRVFFEKDVANNIIEFLISENVIKSDNV